jgi:hypothetical protein
MSLKGAFPERNAVLWQFHGRVGRAANNLTGGHKRAGGCLIVASSGWEALYTVAMLERDPRKFRPKAMAAQAVMRARLQVFPRNDESPERRALLISLQDLDVLLLQGVA